MPEIMKDKRVIVEKGDEFVVTRTTSESYDAGALIRAIAGLEQQAQLSRESAKECDEILAVLNSKKDLAEEIQAKAREKMKIEREAAIKKVEQARK